MYHLILFKTTFIISHSWMNIVSLYIYISIPPEKTKKKKKWNCKSHSQKAKEEESHTTFSSILDLLVTLLNMTSHCIHPNYTWNQWYGKLPNGGSSLCSIRTHTLCNFGNTLQRWIPCVYVCVCLSRSWSHHTILPLNQPRLLYHHPFKTTNRC